MCILMIKGRCQKHPEGGPSKDMFRLNPNRDYLFDNFLPKKGFSPFEATILIVTGP